MIKVVIEDEETEDAKTYYKDSGIVEEFEVSFEEVMIHLQTGGGDCIEYSFVAG